MNPFRAFYTFWIPTDGIKALLSRQASAIELDIMDAELSLREAHFRVQSLRAQHDYLMKELEGQGVDNFPPVGDNGPIPPGGYPPIPQALADFYRRQSNVPTP